MARFPAAALISPAAEREVILGAATVRIGEELRTVAPGESALVPGAVPHTFANLAEEPARVAIVVSPAGFESYFAELAPLVADGPPDPAAAGALAARYGVENVGPPIPVG